MISKEQKKEMMDYLVSRLEPTYRLVVPKSQEIVSGIVSNYIVADNFNGGIVLLVDQIYRGNSFEEFYKRARVHSKNVASVVIKDGETFFRNAMERNYFKKDKELSLKGYVNCEMQRMILFRPEEIFLFNLGPRWLQYFQPKSERLNEGIESFRFEPVIFDYSHINPHERFRPHNTNSKRLYVWKARGRDEENLKIVNGSLERNLDII